MARSNWEIVNTTRYPKGDNPLDNPFYGYKKTELTLPDRRSAVYHGVEVGPCVHVVAVTDTYDTFLVKQSRPNVAQLGALVVPTTLELPGGFADDKMDLTGSAAAELRSEVGCLATNMVKIGQIYPSPGLSDEIDTIFLATGVEIVDKTLERVEATEADMDIVSGNFGTLFGRLTSGEFPVSGQTVTAMAMAARHL